MLASIPLNNVRAQLSDSAGDRWASADLLGYLNLGRREIVKLLPKRFREFRTVLLVAGADQTVPSDCLALLGVIRNRGSTGTVNGQGIEVVDRDTLDAYSPGWRSANGVSAVREAIIEDPRGKTYLVNPPVATGATVRIEIELAAALTDLTAENQDIGMADQYQSALEFFVQHKAYGEDTEEGSAGRSAENLQAFYQELGIGGEK